MEGGRRAGQRRGEGTGDTRSFPSRMTIISGHLAVTWCAVGNARPMTMTRGTTETEPYRKKFPPAGPHSPLLKKGTSRGPPFYFCNVDWWWVVPDAGTYCPLCMCMPSYPTPCLFALHTILLSLSLSLSLSHTHAPVTYTIWVPNKYVGSRHLKGSYCVG